MAGHDDIATPTTTPHTTTTPASVLGTPPASPTTATFDNDDVLSEIFRLLQRFVLSLDARARLRRRLGQPRGLHRCMSLRYSPDSLFSLILFPKCPEGEHHSENSTANNPSVPQDVLACGHVNANAVTHQAIAQATANVTAVAPSLTSSHTITDVAQDNSHAVINFMTPEWIAFFQSSAFSNLCAHGMPVDRSPSLPLLRGSSTGIANPAGFHNQELKEASDGTNSPGAGGTVDFARAGTDINGIKLLTPRSRIATMTPVPTGHLRRFDPPPPLAAKDVKGHYWHKGNIKYWYAM
ncbi:hypothetical protein QFC20_007378 [Naganishia adeliensis]|uniref:Uncharacterized protein n=1 Tax=Naganishia adeliensis TaxID=92952 RepID=A0ACC2UZV2_9TREE|nr:hypothetical protein QFC20_007378 [Naganishia adeliensis]